MHISFGWILFLGGLFGALKVLRAVSLRDVGIGNADELKPMTSQARVALLALNLSLAIGGAILIQKSHNWNPLKPCPSCKLDNGAVS